MTTINELIQFNSGEKARSAQVNQNFENLRISNNEHEEKISTIQNTIGTHLDKSGGVLTGALQLNKPVEINCGTEILTLTNETNYFIINGTSSISQIVGLQSGIVILEFSQSRMLRNSVNLILQNNVDKLCFAGDIGIYYFNGDNVKEINYFTKKEEHTNSFLSQCILDCPKNDNGRADFIKKIEFTGGIIPAMTVNPSDVCFITGSSSYSASYLPQSAFRGTNVDALGWLTTSGVPTGWLKAQFLARTPKVVGFSITARNGTDAPASSPRDFKIEGSNDDTNWELLGDYVNVCDWCQNEMRYFALNYSAKFKYYRINITAISGGTYVAIGMLQFYEAQNDYAPMTAKIELSVAKPLLLNNGKGMSLKGKTNEMRAIADSFMLENLLNNSMMYIGIEKQENGEVKPVVTTAQPVYTTKRQKHSARNSVPSMISNTTSTEFKHNYLCSASTCYGGYPACSAYDSNLTSKWLALVVGNNQWLQFDFPTFRKMARFGITASIDGPTGCVKNGYIKGFNGTEWIILAKITNQTGWTANQVRYFDAEAIENCSKFQLEITELENPGLNAQVARFEMFELAYCFVIPENKFYLYNSVSKQYEEKEINFIGRIKTEHNFVKEVQCYAPESKYISEEIFLGINSTYAFSHNLGHDYKNVKINAWIKDIANGFIMPWCVHSVIDYSFEVSNYGFYVDDCLFYVRTPGNLMQYKDYNGVNRTITSNASLVLQIERSF